mgnify:CR=1 FL=1
MPAHSSARASPFLRWFGSVPTGSSAPRFLPLRAFSSEVTADEWEVGRRYFSQETTRKLSEPEALVVVVPEPLRLAPVH